MGRLAILLMVVDTLAALIVIVAAVRRITIWLRARRQQLM